MREEVEKWLEKAKRDLFASEINLNERLYEVSAFLSHQTVEKGLKALYILKFKKLWKTHDLKQLADRVNVPNKIIKICDALNPHYVETRYPIDVDYNREMAEVALNNAKEVIKWVEKKIKRK
ncbi:MAG: HEPN domain-containing protein [Candidatus Thermoplasmatota archaeon]